MLLRADSDWLTIQPSEIISLSLSLSLDKIGALFPRNHNHYGRSRFLHFCGLTIFEKDHRSYGLLLGPQAPVFVSIVLFFYPPPLVLIFFKGYSLSQSCTAGGLSTSVIYMWGLWYGDGHKDPRPRSRPRRDRVYLAEGHPCIHYFEGPWKNLAGSFPVVITEDSTPPTTIILRI